MRKKKTLEPKKIIQTISEHSDSNSTKGKLLWSLAFVVIAALTILAITSQGGFSIEEFSEFISSLHMLWYSCKYGLSSYMLV